MRIVAIAVAAAVAISGLAFSATPAQAATPDPTIRLSLDDYPTVTRAVLFSTVRDGYYDRVDVDAHFTGISYSDGWYEKEADAWTVTDQSGAVVYTETGWTQDNEGSLTWDGKDSAGALLPVGTYTITATALFGRTGGGPDMRVTSNPVTVLIKRETYDKRITVSRRGDQPNSKFKQGRGMFYHGIYSHSYVADSWGGTLTLRYRVTVPKGGFNVKIRRYVYLGDSHVYSKGRVRDTVTKVGPRTWVLTVTASNWGAAEVDGFDATYSVRRVR